MSYVAHFEGGPLHGTVRVISSPVRELYFPMLVQASWKEDVDTLPSIDMHTAVYTMKGQIDSIGDNEFQYRFDSVTCPNEKGNDEAPRTRETSRACSLDM